MRGEEIDAETYVLGLGGVGELHTLPRLKERVLELVASGKQRFLVEFSEAMFEDVSPVLPTLMDATKSAGGSLALVCGDDTVARSLAVTGISALVPVYTSRDQALAGADASVSPRPDAARSEGLTSPGPDLEPPRTHPNQRTTAPSTPPTARASTWSERPDKATEDPWTQDDSNRYEAAQRGWRWTRWVDDQMDGHYTGIALLDAAGRELARGHSAKIGPVDEGGTAARHLRLLRALPADPPGSTVGELEEALGEPRHGWYPALVREVESGHAIRTGEGRYVRTIDEFQLHLRKPPPAAESYDWEAELDSVVAQGLRAEERREARRVSTRVRRAWAALNGEKGPSLGELSGRRARDLAHRAHRRHTGVFAAEFQHGRPIVPRRWYT